MDLKGTHRVPFFLPLLQRKSPLKRAFRDKTNKPYINYYLF